MNARKLKIISRLNSLDQQATATIEPVATQSVQAFFGVLLCVPLAGLFAALLFFVSSLISSIIKLWSF